MNRVLQKLILLLIFLSAVTCAYAQVNISLSVSPDRISKDEYATLKIIIENSDEVQQVTPPSLKDFFVLSGPNQERGMSAVNGNVKKYTALSFVIKPKRSGSITIDAATVRIMGKVFRTNTVRINVQNTTSPNSQSSGTAGNTFPFPDPFLSGEPSSSFNDYILHKGENVAEKVNRNMFLKLETDKSSCYVGEPVVAVYKLYTRLKSDSKLTENPSFNGFSVIDLTRQDGEEYTREKVKGREYNVYTIRKAQLYPLQPGSIALEPAELENNIQFIKDEYLNSGSYNPGFFDDMSLGSIPADGIINQVVSLRSNSLSIDVKALPETNKPAGFTGAVGNFSITARILKPSFALNETGVLQVSISGSGNLQMLTAPTISWPAGIDVFEPAVNESLNKASTPLSGIKYFEFPFSSDSTGKHSLPAISFSYFDPVAGNYKTISTDSLSFNVTAPEEIAGKGTDKAATGETVSGINRIFSNRWWIIAFLGVAVISGLLVWLRKGKKAELETPGEVKVDVEANNIVEACTFNQKNPFSKTEECLNMAGCNDFYALLNTELKECLAHKFKAAPHEINARDIASILDRNNISNETALKLQQLLRELEWKLYTPFERNESMKALYDEAHDLVQLINTYDIRHQ